MCHSHTTIKQYIHSTIREYSHTTIQQYDHKTIQQYNHKTTQQYNHLFLFFLLLFSFHLSANETIVGFSSMDSDTSAKNYFIITEISLSGNKRTKEHIIFRELDFAVGDTLQAEKLIEILEENRNQVYNTTLFNDVKIEVKEQQGLSTHLHIAVEERWYVFPVPIFELTDRNFNVWWKEYNRDLSRTEYGLRFYHYNFRGRKELLKATVQFGFTKKYELEYIMPFIDKARKIGAYYKLSYILNRELPFRNFNNRQEFYKHEEGFAQKRFNISIGSSLRPNIHSNHRLFLDYVHNSIVDTLAEMNPNYFLDGKTQQTFLQLVYDYSNDQRDIVAYPLSGSYFNVQFLQTGLGVFGDVGMTSLVANYTQYVPLGNRFYALGNVKAKLSLPDKQPFFNQRGLGYGLDYLRGYEFFIIDGQSFSMFRTAFKYQLLSTKLRNPLLKSDQFRTIPLAIYLKTFGELGYIKDDYYQDINPLANQWLKSAGIGVDIFSFYDLVASFEYTRNGLKDWGFYVSFGLNYD